MSSTNLREEYKSGKGRGYQGGKVINSYRSYSATREGYYFSRGYQGGTVTNSNRFTAKEVVYLQGYGLQLSQTASPGPDNLEVED